MGRLAGDSPGQAQPSNLDSNIGLGLSDVVSATTIATNSTTVTTMNAGSTITTKATNASTSPVVNSATTSPATATMSPPVPVPLPSSPTDAMSNHASASISSVDSEVPPPHVPGSPVAYSAVGEYCSVSCRFPFFFLERSHVVLVMGNEDTPLLNVEPRERKLSVSSLNPSSSRFVLRIPLLGRPKVPLEQVVGVVGVKEKERQMGDGRKGEGTEREEVKVGSGGSVPREESTASESSQSPNLSDPQTPPPSAAQAALSAVQVTSEDDVKAELDAPSIPINESSQVATDSRGLESGVNYGWWGYLGWGGGGSSSPQQSSDQDPKENMTSEHPNSSTIATSTSTTSTPTVVISQAQGRTEGAKQGQGQGDAEQQAKEGNPDITVSEYMPSSYTFLMCCAILGISRVCGFYIRLPLGVWVRYGSPTEARTLGWGRWFLG